MRVRGAAVAWVTVIILMALMTVWAAQESASAAVFVGSCLFLLIVVPLVMRSPKD